MPRARTTVIDLDHDRLAFVSGVVGAGKVTIQAAGNATRPPEVDVADPEALGAWVGEQLKNAGIGGAAAGRVIVCVPRGNVVMKRLAFPGLTSHDDPDLVEMVRLSMIRQMPMKVDGTAIDFIPLVRVASAGADATPDTPRPAAASDADGPGVEVLACAFPGDRVAWCRAVAQAAGVRLGALTLRASGAATLLTQHADAEQAPVMGVAIGWSSVEFMVVDDGEIVFVRSADVPLTESEDPDAYAQRIAVEAKRTWMAYRVSHGSTEVGALVVVGSGDLAAAVSERCASMLEIASSTCGLPSFVTADTPKVSDGPSRDPRASLTDLAAAPLIGLLVATASSRPIFDFARPRRAPDTSAGLRRGVLLVALGLIVVVGGAGVFANIEVERAQSKARAAETRARELGARITDLRRADMRLRHLESWLDADVDWLSHWARVTQAMPSPPAALMDSFGGSLTRASVLFEPGGSSSTRTYSGSTWGLELQAVFHATGRLSSRDIGNQFRERLVKDPTYVVESRGSDTEDRFDMSLTTASLAPAQARGDAANPALAIDTRATDPNRAEGRPSNRPASASTPTDGEGAR